MAQIVLGLGTSHTPMISSESGLWPQFAEIDEKQIADFAERAERSPDFLAAELTPAKWEQKYQACQVALHALSSALDEADPDVIIVTGNDQLEMFVQDTMPMLAVLAAESLVDHPVDEGTLPPILRPSNWATHTDVDEVYRSDPALASHIIDHLVSAEFDVALVGAQIPGRNLPHTYTFVRRRILESRPIRTILPIFINTYYPPNTPSPRRCIDFEHAIGEAIVTYPEDLKVAVVASGGLSHVLIDEEFDREVIRALGVGDMEALSRLPTDKLVLGTSETLNWVTAGAILGQVGLKMDLVDYVPTYRTLAGTGVGCTFGIWR